MKVGLAGFTFSNANKGCEALTYCFLNILQKILGKNLEVCYYSFSTNFGKVKEYYPDIKFSNQTITRKDVILWVKKAINTCDYIFDITFGDGFADIYNPKGNFRNTYLKQLINRTKTPLVLLPQTYGPFKNKLLEMQAASAIRHCAKAYTRDPMSADYVRKISGKDIMIVTDLAFALPFTVKKFDDNGKMKLGINVSGLLWKGGFYKDNQFGLKVDYKEYITGLIEHFSAQPDYEIHLIPHVVETVQGSNDGDLYVNELLSKKYPALIRAPAFEDPLETKNYFAGMDIVTAARMHASIDAFSSSVPVVPFAYSRKFEGLYGSLDYKYIVDGCRDSTATALKKTIEWIEKKDELKASVISAEKIVDEKMRMFVDDLKNFMKG